MSDKRLGNNPFADNGGGLDALISPTKPAEPQTPVTSPVTPPRPASVADTPQSGAPIKRGATAEVSKKGLSAGYTRATFIVSEAQVQALKDHAYIARKQIKDVVAEAFSDYLNKHKEGK